MPRLTADEIAAKDAARLNELGYKQVKYLYVSIDL
jgi:hypothetical protein